MRYLTILSLLWLILPLPSQAAETHGLYEAEVEVPDQGPGARTEGMRQAMAAVLLKVSGTSRVNGDAALAEAMQSPARYVQQYRYRSESPGEEAPAESDGKAPLERLLLQVNFDQKSIDGLLRSQGYNIWGEARPATLIWLAVEDSGSRVLVGANDGGLLRELFDREAERRALPIVLPLLDLNDQRRVRTADVWGEFLDTIREASQRYDAQALLVGRLYPLSSRRWEARWALDYRGEVERWQSQSGNVEALVSEVVGRVTDTLAQRFAQSFVAGSGQLLLRVEGVTNLSDYRRVLDYLKGVHGVRQATAETLSAAAVRFRLATEGGSEAVLQVIALGDTLERIEQPQLPEAGVPMPTLRPLPPGAARNGTGSTASGTMRGEAAPDAEQPVETAPVPAPPELVFRLLP
jgi:hypothetical protein